MGDFVVYRKDKMTDSRLKSIIRTLGSQGQKNPKIIEDDSYTIVSFEKSISPIKNFYQSETGDFCISSGCFFYNGLHGEDALRKFLKEFNPNKISAKEYLGTFTLIIKKNGTLYILSDPLGGARIFHNTKKNIWCSSFLALAENSPKLTIDKQGVYEYCFQETTYGHSTPFKEIKLADSLSFYELSEEKIITHDKLFPISYELSSASYNELLSQQANLMKKQMKTIVSAYGQNITTALSGGYDSRLLLSLLIEAGVTPKLYVYGGDSSPDVQVAKSIAKGEGLEIKHVDKSKHKKPSPEQYAKIINDNYYGLDGFPYEGIYDFGGNMETRIERSQNSTMVLNGGGGEIYRNFFYLPEKKYSINDLISVFYNRFSQAFCTAEFDASGYQTQLKEKIKHALKLDSDHMTRTQVEYAYPGFRLRYWTSKDYSNSSRLGNFLTPFISYENISSALQIPLNFKTHGKFQGDLINKISPTLASYYSDYGFPFNQKVPFKNIVKNNLTIYRPIWLRKNSYAIQHHLAKKNIPETINSDYMSAVMPTGVKVMDKYFKIEEIKDPGLLGRVMTLEYMFQKLIS